MDREPGTSQTPSPTRIPPGRTWLWFAIALILNFLLARYLVPGAETCCPAPKRR